MARFRANADDAYILTNVQNQENGDNDWVKYQVITKDKCRLPLHSDTTNSLLKIYKNTIQISDPFNDNSELAFYPLDGNANDAHNQYNGTWNGTEQYGTGRFGQAAKFDGNSYITTPLTTNDFSNSITISTWIYNVVDDGSCQTIIQNRRDFDLNNSQRCLLSLIIDFRSYARYITAYGGDGTNLFECYYDLNNINFNVPHHLVATRIESTIKLFVDGLLVDSDENPPYNPIYQSDSKFYIGGNLDSNNFCGLNGFIDQIRIFNRVLNEDEVLSLYYEGLTQIRKYDQIIIYNATDGAKIHEVTSITDNDTDQTYDIDISSLSLSEVPTNVHQLTKSVDLTSKIDTSNTTATTLVLQDALENPTLVKNGETLVIDGYKLENINVTRSLDGGSVKYSIDISSLNRVPSEVILIKPRVEISVGDKDKANAGDLVLDVLDSTTTSVTVGYYDGGRREKIKQIDKIDTDTGIDLSVIQVVEEYIDPTKIDPFNDNSELAFYPLDGNANDAHNQYNGIWNGTEQYDTGRFGQAAKFDGNSAIELPKEVRNGHTTFSISFWFCLEVDSEDTVSIYSESITTSDWPPNNGIKISAGCGDAGKEDKIVFSTQDGNYTIIADKPAILEYHHIVITSDGDGNYKAYFDGQFKSSIYDTDSMSDIQVVKVGSHYLGPDLYDLQGRIDNLRIFNRALTEKEIKYLYGEGKYKFNLNLQTEQSSSPTKTIIRPTIQDILELDPNNTTYDNTNDLVNMYYQPVQKGNGFRSVQVKWNAHKYGDKNSSLRINLWKKVV